MTDAISARSPSRDADASPSADRGARRRLRTRARLVDAARRVFAQRGVDVAAIAEITDEADVGVGSFYNHFRSKEGLLGAVVADSIATLGGQLDRVLGTISDPAEIVATGVRHVVRRASTDPVFGWFLVRASQYLPTLVIGFAPRLLRDVHHGIESGRFCVRHETIAVMAIGGAVLSVMQAMLVASPAPDTDVCLAEQILQLLGLPPAEAREIAARRLPELPDDEGDESR